MISQVIQKLPDGSECCRGAVKVSMLTIATGPMHHDIGLEPPLSEEDDDGHDHLHHHQHNTDVQHAEWPKGMTPKAKLAESGVGKIHIGINSVTLSGSPFPLLSAFMLGIFVVYACS